VGQGSRPATAFDKHKVIRSLRCALGWSQGRLAAELCKVSGHPTVTREDVSRWEHSRRVPGPFWITHLAAALRVPRWALEERVQRRDMLKLAGAIAGSAMLGTAAHVTGEELYSSIAAGDASPLGLVQTSHETDLMLATLAGADQRVVGPSVPLDLGRWLTDKAVRRHLQRLGDGGDVLAALQPTMAVLDLAQPSFGPAGEPGECFQAHAT